MASRAQILESVRNFRWLEVQTGLAESPNLIDYRDTSGRNLLHIACGVELVRKMLSPEDSVRMADVLLNAGADINKEAFHEGSWKATPLWYTIARGQNLHLARHLLQRGSVPNHCLWAAAFRDDVVAVTLLLDHGADVDPVTEDETPFLSAVKGSHFRAAEVLLERGADVNFQDSKGMTAIHYMLKKNSDQQHFQMLIRHGARGDLRNDNGVTAASLLAKKRDPELRNLANLLKGRQETH